MAVLAARLARGVGVSAQPACGKIEAVTDVMDIVSELSWRGLIAQSTDLDALRATQARLLDGLWPTLAPGGVLLYATCSILREENERQVEAFLARTADAQVEPLDDRYGHPAGAGRQRLPGEDGMDGFFYARLRKRAP